MSGFTCHGREGKIAAQDVPAHVTERQTAGRQIKKLSVVI
ncbi:hypothetical protein ABI_46690 [Asticcacaulis biprosthecium C19]|uniref:Uncharacterized protein n=1 Tax=Asticcacaulis biprosthecium C19 TaxID=715226 RepID=F4QU22_9CAUL|nr:hypothetical protein ABI_46690 [Asticcacaulis biprosthecium C19]